MKLWFQKATGPVWDDNFEAVISFEIVDPGQGFYRRPYVAVWLEDKDGLAVRTLSLWYRQGRGMRWLPDLRRWFRGERMRQMADGGDLTTTAISGPTRQPGKYSVVWNGKDDKGKPVTQGKYFVCVEIAREHGSYQLIRKELAFGNQPLKADLGSNYEIKTASIEYRRRR